MQQTHESMIASEFSTLVQNALALVLRYRRLIIMIFAVVIFLGIVLSFSISKKYTAVSTLLIQDEQLQMVPDDETKRSYQRDDLELSTQRELLLSRDLVKKVIEETDTKISPSAYLKKFSVSDGLRSRVLSVSYTDKDPERAANIVNAHVDAYMNAEIAARKEQIDSIRAKADETIEELKETRAKKSQLAQDLRQENNLIKGRNSEELIYEQISDISDQIPPIEAKKYAVQSKLEALENAGEDGVVSDIVDSYLIQQLKVEENKRAQEYQLLRSEMGSDNPDLMAARRAWQAASGAIKREIENVRTSMENELAELQRQEDDLNTRLKELGGRANFQQGKMIKLKELELEEAASQKLLDGLLERYEQIQSQASFLQPKARIVTRASIPDRPSGPNRPLIIIISVIFAGIISAMVILFKELKSSSIKNFDDVRRVYNQEPLGIIPKFANGVDVRNSLNIPSNKEAIRKIILKSILPHRGGSILVTSPRQQEGRGTVAATLGNFLALSGHKVLIIGIDSLGTTTPFLSQSAGRGGVHEILRGEGAFNDYARQVADGLTYLPPGKADFKSSEAMLAEPFAQMLSELQRQYDFVLIDASPVLAHGESETISTMVSGVLLVVEWMKTDPKTLELSLKILQASKSNILGVVLNKVDIGMYKRLNPGADFLLPRV
jgi:uncharacterized protein involved in exopolysaccharide biosynthesis